MGNLITYIILVLVPLLISIMYYTINPLESLGIAAGLIVWSLAEYGFHRFAFHNKNLSPATHRVLAYNHAGHHNYPDDGKDLLLPLRLTVPIALALFVICWLTFTFPAATFFLIGLFIGLSFYELVHWQAHHRMYNIWPLNYLTRRHMKHHYEDEDRMFGVTSPLWDIVLGTR